MIPSPSWATPQLAQAGSHQHELGFLCDQEALRWSSKRAELRQERFTFQYYQGHLSWSVSSSSPTGTDLSSPSIPCASPLSPVNSGMPIENPDGTAWAAGILKAARTHPPTTGWLMSSLQSTTQHHPQSHSPLDSHPASNSRLQLAGQEMEM